MGPQKQKSVSMSFYSVLYLSVRFLNRSESRRLSYIIDLEAATHFGVTRPSLSREFYCWGLAGVSPDAREGGVDPMVPDRDAFDDYWPSEQELVKMAAAAVGKPTRPKTYPRDRMF